MMLRARSAESAGPGKVSRGSWDLKFQIRLNSLLPQVFAIPPAEPLDMEPVEAYPLSLGEKTH